MSYTTPESLGLCPYCHKSGGHKAGCPNDKAPIVDYCGICGKEITAGEDIIDFAESKYHFDCFCDLFRKEA